MTRPSPDIVHLQETDVLWWDSDKSCGEEVKGQRFHQCLNQFKRHQESKTASSNFSINIVIITEKTVLASEIGTRPAGLSITKEHFDGLVAAFHLLPSFKGSKPRKTGYHDYIKDDLSVHNESLIFAARTPRLRNEVLFFTMRIWPPTNSMMCIITVPMAEHTGWLWRKLSDHDPRIMTCPVYLFNLLCKRLDYENEEIASKVLSTFELQETEMEKYCGNVEAINKKNMYEEHKNAIIQLNKLNMDLMDLGCTTDFEFSALGFAESIMDRYKELYQAPNPPNNLPRISNEESRVFQDEIKSLQTATKLRQATRRHAQDRAEHMVCLLRANNH